MTKGVGRTGCRNDKAHTICRRCGKSSFHIQRGRCASCGYPAKEALRRRTQGTGRMRYMKKMPRKARHKFREGGQAKAQK